VKLKKDVLFSDRHTSNTVTAGSVYLEVILSANIIFIVAQCFTLGREMLGHKTHVLLG
jgi:hypothetical protein